MNSCELVKEKVLGLPPEDAVVLQKYAMWNPQLIGGILCDPCNHCSPKTSEDVKQRTLRYLHGECHCHPCGTGPKLFKN